MKHYRQLQTSAGWRYASYGIALLVIAPVAVIFASWALPVIEDHWSHLFKYLLLEVLLNTLGLLLGVGILSAILGTGTAWICSQYQFFGAAFFRRALIFPFAIPAYVNAFVYVGLLDYAGPLRTFLRDKGLGDGFIPEIRTLSGGIVLMALSLYPYVYVLAYNAFESQGRGLREVARSLGQGPLQIFWRLAIPFARPWIIGGVCLAGLEVLNDFGTVSVIGISTFTSAIYKVWFAFFSPETAAQLSSFLITLAFLIYAWDQYSRKRRSYTAPSSLPKITPLNRSHSFLAFLCCFVLFTLAFLIPFLQVSLWAYANRYEFISDSFLQALLHSAVIGICVATTTCVAAGVLVLSKRWFGNSKVRMAYQLSQLGYGIPGSVIAVGIFIPLAWLDRGLVRFLETQFSYSGGLILTGTIMSMVVALAIRFLAVASSSIDAGIARINPRLDEAATLYGVYGWAQFQKIHWPFMKHSFLAGFLLVFVDVIKEMPLTLITRPFGWDTLSVRIYSLISEGEWQRASVPSLGLILIGIVPLLFFSGKKS